MAKGSRQASSVGALGVLAPLCLQFVARSTFVVHRRRARGCGLISWKTTHPQPHPERFTAAPPNQVGLLWALGTQDVGRDL